MVVVALFESGFFRDMTSIILPGFLDCEFTLNFSFYLNSGNLLFLFLKLSTWVNLFLVHAKFWKFYFLIPCVNLFWVHATVATTRQWTESLLFIWQWFQLYGCDSFIWKRCLLHHMHLFKNLLYVFLQAKLSWVARLIKAWKTFIYFIFD